MMIAKSGLFLYIEMPFFEVGVLYIDNSMATTIMISVR